VAKSYARFTRDKVSGAAPYFRGPFMKATGRLAESLDELGVFRAPRLCLDSYFV
jgi:hypothetical protein